MGLEADGSREGSIILINQVSIIARQVVPDHLSKDSNTKISKINGIKNSISETSRVQTFQKKKDLIKNHELLQNLEVILVRD